MKHYFLLLVMAFTMMGIHAQQIETKKVFGGYIYTQNGNVLKLKDMANLMRSNKELYPLVKSARTNTGIANVLGFIGGGLIGYPLGQAIGSGDPNWIVAGVGAGILGISIPIASSANKKLKKAVDGYNATLATVDNSISRPNYALLINPNGIGLAIHF